MQYMIFTNWNNHQKKLSSGIDTDFFSPLTQSIWLCANILSFHMTIHQTGDNPSFWTSVRTVVQGSWLHSEESSTCPLPHTWSHICPRLVTLNDSNNTILTTKKIWLIMLSWTPGHEGQASSRISFLLSDAEWSTSLITCFQ